MHVLSIKVALGAALGTFLVLVLPVEFGTALLAAFATAVAAYTTALLLLKRRLSEAQEGLRAIQQHRFERPWPRQPHPPDELDSLLSTLEATAQRVEKEIQEMRRLENHRREFVGNVSHELKTPIFAVQGFAETLLDGALEDESVRRSFVEKILRNAARLGNMARDLSELSKIETGQLRLAPRSFSLHRLAREVVESLEVLARERDVPLAPAVPEELPPALADREAIRQVLLNLVDNAIKYNNPGGRVEIFARQIDEQSLRVSVVDNGLGIDPQDLPRVTERFFRVDKSRSRSQGGTGLGLAIVKHLLAVHHRKLLIDSTPGKGSTFGFTLPVAHRAPQVPAPPERPAEATEEKRSTPASS